MLNVASTAAFQPLPGQAGYGAAKAFVLSYTRSLAAELQGHRRDGDRALPRTGRDRLRQDRRLHAQGGEGVAARSSCGSPAPEVARTAVAGMDAGKVVVIPGAANKVGAGVLHDRPEEAARLDPGEEPPRPALS